MLIKHEAWDTLVCRFCCLASFCTRCQQQSLWKMHARLHLERVSVVLDLPCPLAFVHPVTLCVWHERILPQMCWSRAARASMNSSFASESGMWTRGPGSAVAGSQRLCSSCWTTSPCPPQAARASGCRPR